MPGIVGIIGTGSPGENASQLQQMVKCMIQEPFYTSGTYVNERLGLWIGWVAHEGAFSDCMPVWNETKDVCLIFTGEDFTDISEIGQLGIKGHEYNSENASYLVHLYEEIGIGFIEKLNGWFSGVLVDLREQKIVLFNDRYGLNRVYYHENRNTLYFSSVAKSLLKVLPDLRQLEINGLAEFFSCGCVLQNRTLFQGIALLPGASRWTFNGISDCTKAFYFNRESWESLPLLDGEQFYELLKETISLILPRYRRGRQRVAMSLTGGLDGRIIMAWANPASGELPCYTFGSTYRDCTDVRIARRVAKVCHQPHETIVVGSQFLEEFPRLAEKTVLVSDGTLDVSGSVELYVNKMANQIAPVRLTGNYGSEILRGNIAFRPNSMQDNILEWGFERRVRMACSTYEDERQGHPVSFIAFKQVPWHHFSRLAVEQSQLTMRSPFLDNNLVSLMYQAPRHIIIGKEASLHLIEDGNSALAMIPTDRGILYKPIPVFTKCQQLYEEFAFRAEYAFDYGMPQWLAKIDHVLTPLRPERLFFGRHKFYHFRVWYRDKLSRYVKDILLDPRTLARPYLNGRWLEKAVNSHIKGTGNYTSEIHQIITTELIQRLLIEL